MFDFQTQLADVGKRSFLPFSAGRIFPTRSYHEKHYRSSRKQRRNIPGQNNLVSLRTCNRLNWSQNAGTNCAIRNSWKFVRKTQIWAHRVDLRGSITSNYRFWP